MITVLAIAVALIITVYLSLKNFFYLLLLILFIYLIYRFIKESKNNKIYHHYLLKRRKDITNMDLVFSFINQINTYKNIIIDNNNIILIINSGIYFIKITDYNGLITGDITDDFFTKKDETGISRIYNVLKDYNNEFNKYQNKIKNKIEKYLVIKNGCNFKIENNNLKIITMRRAYFEFKKMSQTKNIYDKEKIDIIYKVLNNM